MWDTDLGLSCSTSFLWCIWVLVGVVFVCCWLMIRSFDLNRRDKCIGEDKMTLNFSRQTVVPVNPAEDNMAGRFAIEGMSERNEGVYGKARGFEWDYGKFFDDDDDKSGCFESVGNDIIDLLPKDPFGMGINAATFTTFTGWVEDSEPDRLNIMWNRTLSIQAEAAEGVNSSGLFNGSMTDFRRRSQQEACSSIGNAEKLLSFNGEGTATRHGEGAPNDAMMFVLGYLGVRDLLSADMVCRSFNTVIHTDVLLWRRIHIDQSLSERITDEALLNLSNRAQGNLQYLSLVGCSRITDSCLKHVLKSNPRLTKLNVVGCIGLSVDGIVNNLKAFKSSDASGISHLRIGGRYGITLQHFEELKSLVAIEKCIQPKPNKPHYFHTGRSSPSCDDDRVIDIDICPRCKNVRLVYDCPAESCTQICRACIICIPRCVDCGRCVNDSKYTETFCLEAVCSDCSKNTVLHQETR